jgi:hypothetical protein
MYNTAYLESRIAYGTKRAHYYPGIVEDMRSTDIVLFWGMHTYPKRLMSTEARAARLGLELDRSSIPAWVASAFHDWVYPLYWIARAESIKWNPLGKDELDPNGVTMVGLAGNIF